MEQNSGFEKMSEHSFEYSINFLKTHTFVLKKTGEIYRVKHVTDEGSTVVLENERLHDTHFINRSRFEESLKVEEGWAIKKV